MNWYLAALKKYAVFSGRAQRKEYWVFYLFNFLITLTLSSVEVVLDIAPESDRSVSVMLYFLALC